MEPVRLRLGQLLVDARIISQEQLNEVLGLQSDDGRLIGTLLVERGLVSETQLTQVLSQQLSVPWVSLHHIDFSKKLLSLVPVEIVEKFSLVPIYVRKIREQGDTLYVAMCDPTNDEALRACQLSSGLPTRAMIAPPGDIRNAMRIYYGIGTKVSTRPAPIRVGAGSSEKPAPSGAATEGRLAPKTDEPVPSSDVVADELESIDSSELQSLEFGPPVAAEPPEQAQAAHPQALPRHDETYDESGTVEIGREVSLEELVSKHRQDGGQMPTTPEAPPAGPTMSLTLLDGTTIAVPIRRGRGPKPPATPELPPADDKAPAIRALPATSADETAQVRKWQGLTAHDVMVILQASMQHDDGAASGEPAQSDWQTVVGALLAVLMRKGLINVADLVQEIERCAGE